MERERQDVIVALSDSNCNQEGKATVAINTLPALTLPARSRRPPARQAAALASPLQAWTFRRTEDHAEPLGGQHFL